MLSVIIPTLDSESALVPTLAALVPGATAGLVIEVLVVDGGSRDDTAVVAEAAGCNFMFVEGSLGQRLSAAAAAARAPWLLFLHPGIVLDASWTGEVARFAAAIQRERYAAVFRRGSPAQPGWRDVLAVTAAAIGGRARPDQGLLIAKKIYAALGGHCATVADPERRLLRRIGRRRTASLASAATRAHSRKDT